jgi:hypothetical protein
MNSNKTYLHEKKKIPYFDKESKRSFRIKDSSGFSARNVKSFSSLD